FFSISPPPPRTSSLSLHDALPIWLGLRVLLGVLGHPVLVGSRLEGDPPDSLELDLHPGIDVAADDLAGAVRHLEPDHDPGRQAPDRKSTRLNSSHVKISYAVFCLK